VIYENDKNRQKMGKNREIFCNFLAERPG